jgi:hypothetical protein
MCDLKNTRMSAGRDADRVIRMVYAYMHENLKCPSRSMLSVRTLSMKSTCDLGPSI